MMKVKSSVRIQSELGKYTYNITTISVFRMVTYMFFERVNTLIFKIDKYDRSIAPKKIKH